MTPVIATNRALVVIQLSKVKLSLLLLAALGFVALGIWFVLSPDTFGHYAFKQTSVVIAGVVSIVFFGACAFFIARRLPDNKPGLVLDEEGFTDNSAGITNGLIRWDEVTSIRTLTINRQKLVIVDVSDPEKYIERTTSNFEKNMLKLNYKLYGTVISLSANGLKCSFDELYQLLIMNWEHYGSGINNGLDSLI